MADTILGHVLKAETARHYARCLIETYHRHPAFRCSRCLARGKPVSGCSAATCATGPDFGC